MASRRTWMERTCYCCRAEYSFDTIEYGKRTIPVVGWFRLTGEPACPECGWVSLVMIAGRKRAIHASLTVGWLGVAGVVGAIAAHPWAVGFSYSTASLILGIFGVAVCLWHAAVALSDPNRLREKNARESVRLEKLGLLELDLETDSDLAERVRPAVSRWAYPLLVLGAIGVLFTFGAFALKATSGWAENPSTKPEIVGPADTLHVWFPQHIQAVQGHWVGTPQAVLLVEGETEPISVPVTASKDTWGNTISGKSVSNTRTPLWADVRVPADPRLAGKKVEVRIDMPIQYPTEAGRGFNNVDDEVSTTQVFTLADQKAGGLYFASFFFTAMGALLATLCGVGLWVVSGWLPCVPRRR